MAVSRYRKNRDYEKRVIFIYGKSKFKERKGKTMKTLISLFALVLVFGCAEKKGPAGPTGPIGLQGEQGTQGEKGDSGDSTKITVFNGDLVAINNYNDSLGRWDLSFLTSANNECDISCYIRMNEYRMWQSPTWYYVKYGSVVFISIPDINRSYDGFFYTVKIISN